MPNCSFAVIFISWKYAIILVTEQLSANIFDRRIIFDREGLHYLLQVVVNFPYSTSICFTGRYFLRLSHSGGFVCPCIRQE